MEPEIERLQRQIVELRLRLEQQADGHAALVEHVARREVQNLFAQSLPTPEELRQVREILAQRANRRKMMADVSTHLAKWVGSGVIGYVLYSVWEQVKRGKTP